MFNTTEPFTHAQKMSFETFQAIALKTLEGFEKLAELNMQAIKSSMEENAEQMRSLMTAKDPRALGDWSLVATQPMADKMAAYAKHVYDIAAGTGNEIARVVEKQVTEGNKQFSASIDAMAKTAPAGSEGMVTLLKSAVSAASNAYDQVNKVTKQAVEAAEANLVAAAKAARPAAPRKAA